MKIEIYERATGKVVETHEVGEVKSFLHYWAHQCNAVDYGWRPVKEKAGATAPARTRKPTKARRKRP